jgi:hypothetical protein
MQVKQVQKKAVDQEAVHFTGGLENGMEIAEWVVSKPNGEAYYSATYQQVEPDLTEMQFDERISVMRSWVMHPGDWLVWESETGFTVVSDEEFSQRFEEASGE